MSGSGPRIRASRQISGSPQRTTIDRQSIYIRLHDASREPLPNAWYLIRTGGSGYPGQADSEGWLERRVWVVDDCYRVCWSPEDEPPEPNGVEQAYRYRIEVYLQIDDDEREEAARRRLNNIGLAYRAGDAQGRQNSIAAFQSAYCQRGLEPTGALDDQTFNVLKEVHDDCRLEDDQES